MANITKKVDRGIPSGERSQNFTQVDINPGDIIKVQDSLGKVATHVVVEATAAMTIRFNVQRTIFPERTHTEYDSLYPGQYQNLALGQIIEDETGALVSLAAGESFTLDNDLAIKDIKVVTAAGAFNIFVC
jgi:hypothetical protein